MKNIQLTVWDRLQLLGCIPRQDDVINIRKHLRLMGVLELSDKEKIKVGLVTSTDGSARWKDPDYYFKMEIEDADFEHMAMLVKKRDNWPTTKQTIELLDKIDSA